MASKTQAWPLAKSKQTKVSWAPKQLKNFFPISANMPTCIGLANLCQIISYDHICWHSGSPTHSQGILRFRRPGTLSYMLRITLHYGTNQRGPTIKVALTVANHWPIMHINSGAGWNQSGLQEHRRLVRLEASYQSQFLVWPRRRRSQSNNQTSTLIFATITIWRRWILWKGTCPEVIGLGPIKRAKYVVFLQHVSMLGKSTQIFSIFHFQYAIQVESTL